MLVGGEAHGAGTAVVQRSLMHFGGMVPHAQTQIHMMSIVMLLRRLRMIMITIGAIIVILLGGLTL